MFTGELISGLERCARIPYWGRDWKFRKLKPVEMIEAGVRAGLIESIRTDYGEVAGEECYGLGSDPGLDSKEFNLHAQVVHLAALADAVTCAIRKPGSDPWKPAPPLPDWESACYLSPDGAYLRRIAYVTSWSDDRHYSLCRAWETLGEVCMHNLPMQLVVVYLGQQRDGKFHSHWTHGLRHPTGQKKIRFRRIGKHMAKGFNENWVQIWREDYADISTKEWLEYMLADSALQDVFFKIDVPVPRPEWRQEIIDLAHRKLEIIRNAVELPMRNLNSCDWPQPCCHRSHCHAQEEPGPAWGFVQLGR